MSIVKRIFPKPSTLIVNYMDDVSLAKSRANFINREPFKERKTSQALIPARFLYTRALEDSNPRPFGP